MRTVKIGTIVSMQKYFKTRLLRRKLWWRLDKQDREFFNLLVKWCKSNKYDVVQSPPVLKLLGHIISKLSSITKIAYSRGKNIFNQMLSNPRYNWAYTTIKGWSMIPHHCVMAGLEDLQKLDQFPTIPSKVQING